MARYEKSLLLLEEIRQHTKRQIVVASSDDEAIAHLGASSFCLPIMDELLLPILEVVPLQLLAYHVAVLKGFNPDRPRNLVKSVTVD
jgi:glucosamine--fructose-6-phosphate aminotransferase (isomerizing)